MLTTKYHAGHPRDAPIVVEELRVQDAGAPVGRIMLPALTCQHPDETRANGGILQEVQRSRLIW